MSRLTSWGVYCVHPYGFDLSKGARMAYPDHISHNTTYESVAYLDAERLLRYCQELWPNATFEIQGVRL